ncbi:MAG: hypothetical protein AB1420_01070 [Bacillota bacterium]
MRGFFNGLITGGLIGAMCGALFFASKKPLRIKGRTKGTKSKGEIVFKKEFNEIDDLIGK